MYLLYVDESGNPDASDEQYYVLGGVAVFERQIYWLNNEVEKLAERTAPGTSLGFKAQAIQSHKHEPWHSMKSAQRNGVLDELCTLVASSNTVLFSVALERSTTDQPMARAFEELCNRFDLYLKRLYAQGHTQRGIVVFDKYRYETRLQKMLNDYRKSGTRFGKVQNFAEVPVFTGRDSTRMLELADLVAYAVYRRYQRGDTRMLDRIIGRFDQENEVIHGLVHLTANKNECTCPACLTRKIQVRPA
jgi:hypothetical protein